MAPGSLCQMFEEKINPWKSQFSITGIGDLAEVSEDPINFARKKKKPKPQTPFCSSLSDLILCLGSHSKGQEAVAPPPKVLLQPFLALVMEGSDV